MAEDNQLAERIVRLETALQKDVDNLDKRMNRMETHNQSLSVDVNEQKVKMQSLHKLFGLYSALSARLDNSEKKRDEDHKEIMALLHEKLDKGSPLKVIGAIIAIISLLAVLGIGVNLGTGYYK